MNGSPEAKEKRRELWIRKYQQKITAIAVQPSNIRAYAAGLIDGEGCIFIAKGRPRGVRLTSQYTLKVAVGMSVESGVTWLQKHFEGAIRKRANGQYRPIYRWEVSSVMAERFLRQIIPFMRVKKEEARLGLDFRDHMNRYIRAKGRVVGLNEVAMREAYKLKMEELKHA